MTFAIATLSAWKIFSLLVIASILMIILWPIYGLGFLIAVLSILGWLYPMTYELALKDQDSEIPKQVRKAAATGLVSTIVFVANQVLINYEYIQLFIAGLTGIAILFSQFWLMIKCSKLIQTFDPNLEHPFILIWFWPVGIWFLQPRLKRILSSCI